MTEISSETSVQDRIAHLKELLLRWEREGVPEGVRVPKSARQARAWELPEYQIFPIGSQRDWNMTHPTWGKDIAEIRDIIQKIHSKKPDHRPFEPERLRRLRTQEKLHEAEATLEKVTAQWHEARERAEIAENREQHLLKKLELAEAAKSAALVENAELIRRMSHETKKLQVVN